MATLAPQLVDFLYGDKWGPSAVALRYLMVLMVVRMLTSLAFDILTAVGATKSTVWLNAGWAVALVPALWIGTHLDGIRGAAIAHGVVAVLVALPLAVLALRLAGVSLVPTLPALMRPTDRRSDSGRRHHVDRLGRQRWFVRATAAGRRRGLDRLHPRCCPAWTSSGS